MKTTTSIFTLPVTLLLALASALSAQAAPSARAPFNAAAKPRPAEAKPAPRTREQFNNAAKPVEKPVERAGSGGKGGSGDPPPSAQPTPPVRPVFRPPSI